MRTSGVKLNAAYRSRPVEATGIKGASWGWQATEKARSKGRFVRSRWTGLELTALSPRPRTVVGRLRAGYASTMPIVAGDVYLPGIRHRPPSTVHQGFAAMTRVVPVAAFLLALSGLLRGAEVPPRLDWPYATVDLNVGQSASVKLPNGRQAAVKLLRLTGDPRPGAACGSRSPGDRGDQRKTGHPHFGQLSLADHGGRRASGLLGRARLRAAGQEPLGAGTTTPGCGCGPCGAPWIQPGTFVYPLRQRWFASATQMANEPVFVDGGEEPEPAAAGLLSLGARCRAGRKDWWRWWRPRRAWWSRPGS